MALINRMARLLTADMHAVLDRIEEPDVLLKHAVREMEEELAAAEQRAKLLDLERERLADRQRKTEAALADLEEQVGVAFDAGNEDLARKLVKRKLEAARLGKHFADRHAETDKALAALCAVLAGQRERLDVMRQKAELFAETAESEARDEGWEHLSIGDDEIEVAFLKERQRRTQS